MRNYHSISTPKLITRPLRYLPILILLGLAVHLLLPQLTELEHSIDVVEQMKLWAVGLAILAQMLRYAGAGYLLHAASGVAGSRLTTRRGAFITVGASAVGLVAVGMVGSTAATFRWLRGSGVSREGSILASSLPSLFNNLLLAITAIIGLLHLLIVHDLSTFQAIAFSVILLFLVVIIGVTAWGLNHRPWLTARMRRLSQRWAALRRKEYDPAGTQAELDRVFAIWDALKAGGWRGPMLGAALFTGFDMLTLYLIFAAAGHAVSPGVLLTGYGLPMLLGKVSFLPGGVGVVEGTMTALYNSLGVPDGVTVVVILAYRAISFWLPLLLGFLLVPYLQHVTRSSRLLEEVENVSTG
jgi:uncharacterized membrane protein YbhN (UPF0104 family)